MKLRAVMLVCGVALLGLLALPATSAAVPITGQLAIDNDAGGGVRITQTAIDWYLPFGTPDGAILVGGASTGTFAPLNGTTGSMLDINVLYQPTGAPFPAPPLPAGNNNTVLAGEGVVLANFITFAADSDIVLDLAFVQPGIFGSADCLLAPAAAQTCTVPGTTFSLINTSATTSTASFVVTGFGRRISTGELSTFEGVYSTNFTVPFQTVLAAIEDPNIGFYDNTYSGTLSLTFTPVSAVPEPATLLTFGAGSAILARMRRRKKA